MDRNNPVEINGAVYAVEFYAGSPASDRPWKDGQRPLVVGIFRPNGGGACNFDLVAKYKIKEEFIHSGYVKVYWNGILSLWKFCHSRSSVLPEVISHQKFHHSTHITPEVLSLQKFCPYRLFVPKISSFRSYVPPEVLSLKKFCPSRSSITPEVSPKN